MIWRESYQAEIQRRVLIVASGGRSWNQAHLDDLIEDYAGNLRADNEPNNHWLCVTDLKVRCSPNQPNRSERHDKCGWFTLTPAHVPEPLD